MSNKENLNSLIETDEASEHIVQCDDCTSAVSRRSLLAGLMVGSASIITASGAAVQTAYAAPGYTGDTLIVLSLRGGMDGLSAVPPIGDPAYAGLRPTTAITPTQGVKLDETFALHPSLAGLKPLWDKGQFAVVQGVGSMDRTRSHFSAMEQVENAAPGTSVRTGWLDRVMGLRETTTPFQATQVGGSNVPRMSQGPFNEMALTTVAATKLSPAATPASLTNWTKLIDGMHANTNSPFTNPVHTALAATMSIMNMPVNNTTVVYPATPIGNALKDVAAIIKGGLGLQVATVDQGDWDHHENAGPRMTKNLQMLSDALVAFVADLGDFWKKVTVVTLSEFGRRVKENGTKGFDHGHGNVMLMASGAGLNKAQVYGAWPTLDKTKLDRGEDLAGTTDFRSVFAEVLTKRCQLSTANVATAFPNFKPTVVGAFKQA
jgi:uncharacterized protein (DUF1501 family)